MKKIFLIIFLLSSLSVFSQIDKVLPDAQSPPKLYNDFTKGKNFLTEEQKDFLERKLVAYDDSTSSQIAVVTVPNLDGAEITVLGPGAPLRRQLQGLKSGDRLKQPHLSIQSVS